MATRTDPFGALRTLETRSGPVSYFSLEALRHIGDISRLPFSIRIVLENLLRRLDGIGVTEDAVHALAHWRPDALSEGTIAFLPARVLLQDFTGIPVVADLALKR